MNEGKEYKPIIENAKRETSAKGQCKWIIAMLEILALNHLPHLEKGQTAIKCHVDKSTRKIMWFLFVVLVVVLATNPQVAHLVKLLFAFMF